MGAEKDQRAIGTRISSTVRDTVLGREVTWLDRAFVVSDWYFSPYQPLADSSGRRVGMLCVGILERPFTQLKYGARASHLDHLLGVLDDNTRRPAGTGLGLWISRGLVERYGGDILAAHRPDGRSGAVFTVLLKTAAAG